MNRLEFFMAVAELRTLQKRERLLADELNSGMWSSDFYDRNNVAAERYAEALCKAQEAEAMVDAEIARVIEATAHKNEGNKELL